MKKLLYFFIIVFLLIIIKNNIVSTINLSENSSILSSLRQELERVRREHEFLMQKLVYVKSDEFIEQQAREKLNMVKTNEHVVIGSEPEQKHKISLSFRKELPNWQKWLILFFKAP